MVSAAARLRLGRTAAGKNWRPARSVVPAARCYSNDAERDNARSLAARQSETAPEARGRSFQGQVMGSIGARLRRESQQREEYEKWRNMTDPARNWTMTFGEEASNLNIRGFRNLY